MIQARGNGINGVLAAAKPRMETVISTSITNRPKQLTPPSVVLTKTILPNIQPRIHDVKPIIPLEISPSLEPTITPSLIAPRSGQSSGGSSSLGAQSTPMAIPEPGWRIANIINEQGESVLFENAATVQGIRGDWAGREVILRIQGYFVTQPPISTSQVNIIQSNGLHWQPIAISANEIQIKLSTQYKTDLYLSGPHGLVVDGAGFKTKVRVKVGNPWQTASLFPHLGTVALVKTNGQPSHLNIQASQAMLNPKFQQIKIDGIVAPIEAVDLTDTGVFTLRVPLPDPAGFNPTTEHSIELATPFGQAITIWQGGS